MFFFQKRRAVIIDLCIAVGIPFLVMALREFMLVPAPHIYLMFTILNT
jgi:hypothetical protein